MTSIFANYNISYNELDFTDNELDFTYDELADVIFELGYDTNGGILKSDGTKITASEASIVESF